MKIHRLGVACANLRYWRSVVLAADAALDAATCLSEQITAQLFG